MSEIMGRKNRNNRCREPCFIIKKLLIGFYLILMTGIIAYSLLLFLMLVM